MPNPQNGAPGDSLGVKRGNERRRLEQGLAELGLVLDEHAQKLLLGHLAELRHWGKTYNLVAPGDMAFLLERHLLDALSITPWCRPGALLDVGTGAGFPGLPLAIVKPERHTVMIDSAGKKVRFLRHVVRRLSLEHVDAVHERVERYTAACEFSTITSRAYSSLADFTRDVRHLAGPKTRLLAMKGRVPEGELKALPDNIRVEAVEPIHVPGLEAERNVVIMSVVTNQ